ncbi:MAG: F0F1 ATP synthase subunit A [Candidatus Shapirobacteria bacterium]|nr:F0F1 ATP synthase subunit A [Candidatus Shapirobacteria bacterium]
MNITLAPEEILTISGFKVTNSMLTAFIVTLLLIIFFISFSPKSAKPSKFQLFMETVYLTLKNMVEPLLGHLTVTFLPFLLAFFFFILFSNWFGLLPITGNVGFNHTNAEGKIELIPFFRAPTSDISATLALALISIIVTNAVGFRYSGFKFIKKYIDTSKPINFFVGILELISELGKNVSFTFRLFGNVFAGEVLLIVITSLTYGLATLPFFGLELFIGLIQAFVFFMLTAVFISLAANHEH